MTNENETIADIVAEMRRRADSAFPYDVDTMNMLEPLADRIEAAWKREREAMLKTAMMAKCEVCSKQPVGNAAAMREALTPWISLAEWLVKNAGKDALGNGISEIVPQLRRRIDESRDALATPPRNCDCHNDADSAYIAFCGYDFEAKDISDDAFIDWLFAPAEKGADA